MHQGWIMKERIVSVLKMQRKEVTPANEDDNEQCTQEVIRDSRRLYQGEQKKNNA